MRCPSACDTPTDLSRQTAEWCQKGRHVTPKAVPIVACMMSLGSPLGGSQPQQLRQRACIHWTWAMGCRLQGYDGCQEKLMHMLEWYARNDSCTGTIQWLLVHSSLDLAAIILQPESSGGAVGSAYCGALPRGACMPDLGMPSKRAWAAQSSRKSTFTRAHSVGHQRQRMRVQYCDHSS